MGIGIILISTLLPIAIIALVLGGLMRGQQQTTQLLQTGMPARGRILQLGTTGGSVAVMGHRHLKLVLTVEVQPQMGAPYTATFEQLISELQIPSVQPGAMIELRIDRANPQRMALASVLPAGSAPMPQGPWGQPAGYGSPPPMGMAGGPMGMAGQPMGMAGAQQPMGIGVMTPQYKSAMPRIIFMMLLTTVPIAIVMGYFFVDWGRYFGSSSSESESESDESGTTHTKKKAKGGVCKQAAACCKVISGSASSACDNFDSGMMPAEGCRQALDTYKQSAKQMKKSCD